MGVLGKWVQNTKRPPTAAALLHAMRVLILQPEDSPRRGAWAASSWDLAVDLGKSSAGTVAEWAAMMRCPLLRADEFSRNVEDVRATGQIVSSLNGRLLDRQGLDWWALRSLEILREATFIRALQRLAGEIPRSATLWATRPGWPATALGKLLGLPVRAYGEDVLAGGLRRLYRYTQLGRHFSPGQLGEIALDKYDASYQWRARLGRLEVPAPRPVTLVPSAYTNVSRVATAYARLLPHQAFLLVATRRSAKMFEGAENVKVRDLGGYAGMRPPGEELKELLKNWASMLEDMDHHPEVARLRDLGMFDEFPAAFAQGLAVRNAWARVLDREPVCGVLCGDDTNVNTRLPVLLAALRGLPTVAFHHGAMDGFCLVKRLSSDMYLAKSELERDYLVRLCGLPSHRVGLGGPVSGRAALSLRRPVEKFSTRKTAIVFFSEPYENMGMRAEEVYREVAPRLHALAGATGHSVVMKLHPFESRKQRSEILRGVLPKEHYERTRIVTGPLSESLLAETWAGLTLESTTVLDCASRGVPCFLCGWLRLSPFGYLQQYARFGAGQLLDSVEDIGDIPRRVAEQEPGSGGKLGEQEAFRWKAVDRQMLGKCLGVGAGSEVARPA